MLRQLTALFVAAAIVFGNFGASASTISGPSTATPPATAKNEPPLKPGGAAGIREAQGLDTVEVWVFAGLILGAIIWVLVGNDNDDSDSTNGTNSD